MRTTKHLLITLTATLLLLTAVNSATAGKLSTSSQNLRATWTLFEFAVSSEVSVRCQVTLEGSFHSRTIAKNLDALSGAITRAIIKQEACREGTGATFNGVERYNGTTTPNTLPWHITYKGFTGTLPTISAIRIGLSGFRFGARDSFGLCSGQYGNETDAIQIDAAREAGGAISSVTPVEGLNNSTLTRRDGGLTCPSPGRLRGLGILTQLGATTRITITLI